MSPLKGVAVKLLLAGTCLASMVIASENANWVSLAPAPEGSPPEVTVLESNLERTVLRLDVPGYYVEEVETEEGIYQLPRITGAGFLGEETHPELPVITHWVAIPDQGSVEIDILSEDSEDIPGPKVYPLQNIDEEYYPTRSIRKNQELYAQDTMFPSSPVQASEPMIMRDVRLVAVSWIPIRTNPARGGITVSSSIEVEVRHVASPGANEKLYHHSRMTPSFYQLYQHNIINFDYLFDQGMPEPGGLLVICANNSQVTTRLQPFIEWKRRKGYSVTLATTAQTGSTYGSIKTYIQTAYNTWDPPLEYVVLAGDATGSYAIPIYYGRYDHGYTQLDGTDIIGDVAIGRLSFETTSQLSNIVNKVVSYESTPYMAQTNWFTKAYFLAGTNHAYSTVIVKRYIKQLMVNGGVPNVTIRDYPTSTIPASELRSNVNQGVSFMNYRGSWINEMVCSHFQGQLYNGYMLPLAVAITCGTGTFTSTYSTAVSECWLREGSQTTPAGAVACIGTATSGTHTRQNNIMDTGIFYGMFVKGLYNYGAALVEGKIQLVRAFPFDQTYQQNFSYWNNLMGDPSIDGWTGIPQTMNVTHIPQVIVGQNYLTVDVTDGSAEPIEEALVCLLKDGETFITEYTDESGEVTLPISATTTGTLKVTVTKHNYHPYLAGLNVISGDIVSPTEWGIDDDNLGSSQGNSDGVANPGESIELSIRLKNWGTTQASSVTGVLSEDDEYLTITQDSSDYGNIAAGGTAWTSTDYLIGISGNCPNNHRLDLSIEVSSVGRPTYTSIVPIVVTGADLEYDDRTLSGVGSNNAFDPGETGSIVISLDNLGGFPASDVTGRLLSSHQLAEIVDTTGVFGTIAGLASGSNSTDPFIVEMRPAMFPGQPVMFTVVLDGAGGFTDTVSFVEIVGSPGTGDPTGPDNYGYWAFENVDTDYLKHPSYAWIEIDPTYGGSGILIPLSDYSEDQDDSEVVMLPFDFRFYNEIFSRITVCSNGWLAMDNQVEMINFRNYPIPGAHGPSGMVAALWDDLVLSSGGVYYFWDSIQRKFIVEWSHVRTRYNNSVETFQVILYDPAYYPTPSGDGEILVQYQTVSNDYGAYDDIPYSTVGIESNDQLDGIEYTYWNAYPPSAAGLSNGRAILFTTDTGTQGMGPDTIGPEITHAPLMNTTNPIGPYEVMAVVWDISGVLHADLHYSNNGTSYNTLPMSGGTSNEWTGWIPGQAPGTTVQYFISAVDDSSNYAQSDTFSFDVWDVLFMDNFESGAHGWTHYSGGVEWGDQWHLSVEDSYSPSHAWKCGDTGTGTYGEYLDAYLESPALELPSNAELHFFHRIESEISTSYPDSAYDGGLMEISCDGGPWEQLSPESGYNRVIRHMSGSSTPYTGPFAGGTECWAGTINWTEVAASLEGYQGTCRIRFRFGSDQSEGREGWYIDNFMIIGLPEGPLDPPENLVIQYLGEHVYLDWDAVFGATYYTVYHAMEPEPAVWDSLGTVFDPVTSFQHPEALDDDMGFYYVVAGN
jgi:hypothetical protein